MNTPYLVPYLTFDGNCREAMSFYQQCLGGELMIQPFADTPAAEYLPANATADSVLHASLTNGDLLLFGSDSGGQQVTAGNSVSISINCGSETQIADWFEKLSAGGNVTMPLGDTFWGATFGMFTDRFGIAWMLNYDKVPVEQPV
ncbi:VOC family protein [Hymenobacter lucidus]|uniref:VOC family protein n=1 Tax=Hymenobacter lucidus TaxID=2880930 RepID=A0ABS8APC3_9BACT|nr:VOC family protein [Hymenobacter lucidus]MCB2406847.1 VOC family protein [Hymenobacter lucidus]